MVVKKYGLPVRHHGQLKEKIARLDVEVTPKHAHHYLRTLLKRDFENEPGDYKPILQTSEDIYDKRIKIEQFFRSNKPRVTGRVAEQIAEAEAKRRNQFED